MPTSRKPKPIHGSPVARIHTPRVRAAMPRSTHATTVWRGESSVRDRDLIHPVGVGGWERRERAEGRLASPRVGRLLLLGDALDEVRGHGVVVRVADLEPTTPCGDGAEIRWEERR